VNLARWDVLLSGANRHYLLLLLAGAIVIVEPFWIAAHVVLVRRAGVAETGEDLRMWFRALVIPSVVEGPGGSGGAPSAPRPGPSTTLGMTVIALLLFATTAHAMTLNDYIATLERIRNEPRDVAAVDAKSLIGTQVDAPGGNFTADSSVLDAVANKRADAITRLDATIAALKNASAAKAPAVDPKLLERLRKEESIRELQRGGEVLSPPETNNSILDNVANRIRKAFEWLADEFADFFEWLEKLWPKEPQQEMPKPSGGVPFIVTVLVIAIVGVLLIIALEALRRSRKSKADEIVTSDPIQSRRDEDPLSRGATEWERYAAQLAAAGRIREAIRAWYHAVLVTCYGAGILSFRKGRTNWEYVSMMRAEVAWRPLFADLTRRYEREWYGRAESTPEALDDCSGRAQSILGAIRKRGDA
jgi:hypothetical protein